MKEISYDKLVHDFELESLAAREQLMLNANNLRPFYTSSPAS